MVRLPFVNIMSVRVSGIDPTSDTSLGQGAIDNALCLEDIVDSTTEIDNPEYSKVIVDATDRLLYGLRHDDSEYTPDLSNDTIIINEQEYNAQFIVDFVKDNI